MDMDTDMETKMEMITSEARFQSPEPLGSHVLAVLHCLTVCAGSPVLCSACSVLAVPFWLSHSGFHSGSRSGCPVLAVVSCIPFLAVLSFLLSLLYPALAVLP
jgi:hypothetical protein